MVQFRPRGQSWVTYIIHGFVFTYFIQPCVCDTKESFQMFSFNLILCNIGRIIVWSYDFSEETLFLCCFRRQSIRMIIVLVSVVFSAVVKVNVVVIIIIVILTGVGFLKKHDKQIFMVYTTF